MSEQDLSATDLRTLSPEEWTEVKREAVRRAHAERSRLARALMHRLRCWWQTGRQRRDPVVQTYGFSRDHSLSWHDGVRPALLAPRMSVPSGASLSCTKEEIRGQSLLDRLLPFIRQPCSLGGVRPACSACGPCRRRTLP